MGRQAFAVTLRSLHVSTLLSLYRAEVMEGQGLVSASASDLKTGIPARSAIRLDRAIPSGAETSTSEAARERQTQRSAVHDFLFSRNRPVQLRIADSVVALELAKSSDATSIPMCEIRASWSFGSPGSEDRSLVAVRIEIYCMRGDSRAATDITLSGRSTW